MTPCTCERVDVDHMLRMARTKADLQELVAMLVRRNLRLQDVRDNLAYQLHIAKQETNR